MNKKVLLGMSGGVDSSISALILKEKGYIVVGITFLFIRNKQSKDKLDREAKEVANTIGIEHHTVDLSNVFENTVVKYFIDEYSAGRTPFPCAYCNPKIKFKYLIEYADKLKCQYIATGHYAKITIKEGKKYIAKGTDPDKDQSFFLWGLNRKIVDRIIFPLGDYRKTELRKFAKERGFLKLAEKKDSLGICFIEEDNYRIFLEKRGIKSEPGNFVDINGNVLGKHQGIINYTIGQRRGLGLNMNIPVFVSEFRLDENEIVLGNFDDMYKSELLLESCHYIDNQDVNTRLEYVVKVRYRLQETLCNFDILNNNCARVHLLKPEAMIANGQSAVFYHNDILIGGGVIKSSN